MAIHDKYVLGRDKVESKRLDSQHRLLVKVSGNTLIHPTLPTEQIRSVADIATGTGIWLEDVTQFLERPHIERYYQGFDISSEQFPSNPGPIQLSVHDVTTPFPKEHWNRYDLVHVRLLVAALEESDYRAAITNIYNILKPGGYLQWEEIDEETYLSANPVIQELRRCFDYGFRAEGKCFQASAKVYKESQIVGFVDVERLAYESHQNPDLRLGTDKRLAAIIRTLYPRLLWRSGQVIGEEAAMQRAEALVEEHFALCEKGQSPSLTLMRVVGRKPDGVDL
ncbi:class I SAM-dependent methyltransferase [Aspergillus ibericus CBS 121593]|uniref:LaeA-like methyltransferase n=1 Tax=Aspergillus ibericus CBS 121593 TaxID=1448316 RepID=A0A395H3V2_9EURO|nr:LaeA-like methyltransferase [Aspergillus ibericus CBS 121593]RAL02552.1 LaeA-like methyltransferase [Aspergillus ibericus CBS 121593]